MTVEEKIEAITLKILDVKKEDIVSTATFTGDLGAASIDLVEIVSDIENSFHINISDEQASKLMTVQDAVDFVKSEISDKGFTS